MIPENISEEEYNDEDFLDPFVLGDDEEEVFEEDDEPLYFDEE